MKPDFHFFGIAIVHLLLVGTVLSQEPPRTITVFQRQAGAIAERAYAAAHARDSARIVLSVVPEGSAWFLEQPIFEVTRHAGFVPRGDSSAAYVVEFGVNDMHVVYRNARRTWFLGTSVIDREVSLAMWTTVHDRATGEIVLAEQFDESFADTIAVADVERLETPGVPATRGTLPPAGFFSNVLEPVIFIGSVAVAIYLLFSVRS